MSQSTEKAASQRKGLLSDFPPVTYSEWRKAVEAELKGVPFEKRLVTRTHEGLDLQPVYVREDAEKVPHLKSYPGFMPFVRGASASGYLNRPWAISQELDAASAADFNAAARTSLANGLTAINMVVDRATRNGIDPDAAASWDVGGGGLSIAHVADLERALEGIDLGRVNLFVRSGAAAMPLAALLAALARRRGVAIDSLRGCIEMDPLGVLAHEGQLPQSMDQAYDEMEALTRWAVQFAPGWRTICVHSRPWHEAGASSVQELAFSMATALEYLRAMHQRGLDVDRVAPKMRFALTVGSQFFMEIAKIRAARLIWARLIQALAGGAEARALSIHVRTSQFNKTLYDPHVNLLRTTVEAFAGVLAGCDSLQVGPFDEVIGPPDDFSRRLARNTQLILRHECHLDHVIDPAGGSYYVEVLTDQLARRAWDLLQEVEKRGGMLRAMREGFPQKAVATVCGERLNQVAQRRDVLVGTNHFVNAREETRPVPPSDLEGFRKRRAQQVMHARTSEVGGAHEAVLKSLATVLKVSAEERFEACVSAAVLGATLGELTRALRARDKQEAGIEPVLARRAGSGFEELRQAMERYARARGRRVRVFLANMGPLKQHKARADFCSSFFAAGGFEVISPDGFDGAPAAAEAAKAAGAEVVVICSTDETYPALVPEVVAEVRARLPQTKLVLAGYPPDQVEAHRKAGVEEFVHLRVNALEWLGRLQKSVGV